MNIVQTSGEQLMVSINGYNFPSPLFVTSEHLYIKPLNRVTNPNDKLFLCGLDDFIRQIVGKIQYLSFSQRDKSTFTKSSLIFSIETEKWLNHYLAPFPLKIVKRNENLIENPSLIYDDCYGKGWIIQIQLDQDSQQQLGSLYHEESLVKWIHAEIEAEGQTINSA